jgi:catalase
MQQNSGWFQLESQKQARNSNKNQRPSGSIPDRLIEKKMQEMRMNEGHRSTMPEQNPNSYNVPAARPQQAGPSAQNALESRPTTQPDASAGSFAPTNQGMMTNQWGGMFAGAGMSRDNQNYPMPAPVVPTEEPLWKHGSPQESTALWDNDRILHTKHSQTVGERGPVLEQDSTLHEALKIFISGKILERPVHVKGFGAFGTFQTTNSMRQYTKLSFLQTPGQQVATMVRFSLAGGNKGTPDTVRGVKGFATKFYTPEGVFDLVFNHIPVLFVRDGVRFPQAFTSFFPSPVNNLIDPQRFWRFVASAPEAMHFVTWLYSDAGTVKSFRHISGHSVNTYVWRNAEGVRRYVKYHWLPIAGEETITQQEATALAGINPDFAGQELYDTIAAGSPVQYELRVQLMDPGDESRLPYDPLDCTKVWDERQYPLMPVGVLTLNRNPDNYLEQVEKVAFSPTNLLEGAELSDDKLLQARANIYWDSQRRRLGENFRSISVNQQGNWTPDDLVTSGVGTSADGNLARSEIAKPDNFTQAGERYLSLSPEGQDHLVDNLAADLSHVSGETQRVVLGYLNNASAELGQRVVEQISAYSKQ